MKLSAEEYLLILQMRSDSSLTLTTAEEDYIKGLRLEGKTSAPLLIAKREKWHTYLNYILKVKKDAIASGADAQLISDATAAYTAAKELKQGLIDLTTYNNKITALDPSETDVSTLRYMSNQISVEYQKYIASTDTTLDLNGDTLDALE